MNDKRWVAFCPCCRDYETSERHLKRCRLHDVNEELRQSHDENATLKKSLFQMQEAAKDLSTRACQIDMDYASRLAFALECMLVDSHGHWNMAANLLDEYKREWEKVNPSPPTFMGEVVPRKTRKVGVNPA